MLFYKNILKNVSIGISNIFWLVLSWISVEGQADNTQVHIILLSIFPPHDIFPHLRHFSSSQDIFFFLTTFLGFTTFIFYGDLAAHGPQPWHRIYNQPQNWYSMSQGCARLGPITSWRERNFENKYRVNETELAELKSATIRSGIRKLRGTRPKIC